MQVRLCPTALFSSTPVTVESTPPLRPRITLSPPIRSRSPATVVSMNEAGVQSPFMPQMVRAKLESIFVPSTVWYTSGWNCTAQVGSPANWKAALATSCVDAITSAPSGRREMVSPCDIHTWECGLTPCISGESGRTT